ncbi:MAG TPA: hypothetical protein VLJ58_21360 [Ramlibacter sp.]|nr:hypothetical protein [Ramlibacter sp.]
MSEIALHPSDIQAIGKVRALESALLAQEDQVEIPTNHVLHAGMYARTVRIPAGHAVTGALIKVPTVLIVNGDVVLYTGDGTVHLTGYHVLPAAAGRKTAFAAIGDTDLTMLFPTQAATVDQAEREFTDEFDALLSRKEGQCPE